VVTDLNEGVRGGEEGVATSLVGVLAGVVSSDSENLG
jgi:hypothetical protein